MAHADRPNIVYILADDMGYGDVGCLNPDCRIPTPNLDRLGGEGMIFTDAHSSSAVCTPSRYSILTGRYCWRTWLKAGVLSGVGHPLIEPDRPTAASILRDAGYRTACIGKWHVGWQWAIKPGHAEGEPWGENDLEWIDYTQPIAGGPTTCGFDHFYGISGSLDMPPYVYVNDEMPVEIPTDHAGAETFIRPGPKMASLEADNVLAHLTGKAVDCIEGQSADQPFFLYFPLTAPHTPIAPAPEFVGRSGINAYLDFCIEVDHRVGQVLGALDRKGLAENTLVIFTTDNGASAGPSQCAMLEAEHGHHCSHIYRGYKSDIWDGGHRLPLLARWPAVIAPGASCEQHVGLFDLFATAAELTEWADEGVGGEDSVSLLPAMRGASIDSSRRPALVHHSIHGLFAIRRGKWKLCRCPASGGWGVNDLKDEQARERGLPELQLYDVEADPAEQHNLAQTHPEVVAALTLDLHKLVVRGRSTPGPQALQHGDVHDWPQVNWLPEIPERFVLDD